MRLATERKYGNRHTEIDNIVFDSKHEAAVYQSLRLRQHAGEISNLRCQVPFVLQEGFKDKWGKAHRPIEYVADFTYDEAGQMVACDPKGVLTREFKIKAKLFRFRYPDIRLVVVSKEK